MFDILYSLWFYSTFTKLTLSPSTFNPKIALYIHFIKYAEHFQLFFSDMTLAWYCSSVHHSLYRHQQLNVSLYPTRFTIKTKDTSLSCTRVLIIKIIGDYFSGDQLTILAWNIQLYGNLCFQGSINSSKINLDRKILLPVLSWSWSACVP